MEQMETPGVLYRRPQGLFVADFIGTMNLIQGRYHRDRGALVSGRLSVAGRGDWPDRATETLAFRPEDVTGPDGTARVQGQVRSVVKLGNYLDDTVDSPGGEAI